MPRVPEKYQVTAFCTAEGRHLAVVTIHWEDGTYSVAPAREYGPFDPLDELVNHALRGLDEQMSLW